MQRFIIGAAAVGLRPRLWIAFPPRRGWRERLRDNDILVTDTLEVLERAGVELRPGVYAEWHDAREDWRAA
jgi:hypothetical protein